MNYQEYSFVTNLSPDEIVDIVLKQRSKIFSSGEVAGKSYGNKIELHYSSMTKSSWSPVFHGVVASCGDSSTIVGTFKVNSVIKIFMRIWRGFMIFMFVVLLLNAIASSGMSGVPPLLVPLFMYAVSFLVVKAGSLSGERDKNDILRFIKESLLASPSTPST